jgi:uncharacterized protein YcfL
LETFSTDIQSLINKKIKLISGADKSLFQNFSQIEKNIVDGVMKQVKKMNIKDGVILFDDKNIAMVNAINKVIADAIQDSSYPKNVKNYISSFDTIKEMNVDIHKDVNDLDPAEIAEKLNNIQKTNVNNVLDNLVKNGMEQGFVEPVKQGIFKNIVGGMNLEEFQNYLETTILSDPLKQGQFKRYVTQISRDALNQYDGQINQLIAQDLGLDAYRYVGSLIDDSRPQCRRWVGKEILLKDELSNEITWAFNNGSGMIPGTNTDNFATYRGGYSCRHSAIPFKMTKREREEYDKLVAGQIIEEETAVDQQIKEIKDDVQINAKQRAKALGNQELDQSLFISSQSKQVNDSYNLVMEGSDGANEVANKKNTLVTLKNDSENRSQLASEKSLNGTKNQGRYLPIIDENTNGHCALNGRFMQIMWKEGYVCEFKPIQMDTEFDRLIQMEKDGKVRIMSDMRGENNTQRIIAVIEPKTGNVLASISKKAQTFKWWSMSSAGVANRGVRNIAPTITHESGHLIQFDKDPEVLFSGNNMGGSMRKYNLTLKDSPTEYGEANKKEFFTEAYTFYTYDRQGLKTNHPKVFAWFEDYAQSIGIKLETIIETK